MGHVPLRLKCYHVSISWQAIVLNLFHYVPIHPYSTRARDYACGFSHGEKDRHGSLVVWPGAVCGGQVWTWGSRFFYKLLGIAITFIGIFVATNVISGILEDLAGLLTHSNS